METFNRLLGFFSGTHRDETETARTARSTVHHQVRFDHGAERGKRVLQVVFGGAEGKISYKQFCAHVMFCCLD